MRTNASVGVPPRCAPAAIAALGAAAAAAEQPAATPRPQDEAYWADVLLARAATPSFTQVNASFGWRLASDRVTLKLVAQNAFDEHVQQHIFGDILERKLAGQVSIEF